MPDEVFHFKTVALPAKLRSNTAAEVTAALEVMSQNLIRQSFCIGSLRELFVEHAEHSEVAKTASRDKKREREKKEETKTKSKKTKKDSTTEISEKKEGDSKPQVVVNPQSVS